MPVTMRRRLMALAVLVLLVASLSAVGCAGGSGPEIALAYTFKAGDTWVQEASTTVSGTTEGIGDVGPADTNATTKTRITTKVESVAADGVATITVTTETLESVQDGQPQDFTGTLPADSDHRHGHDRQGAVHGRGRRRGLRSAGHRQLPQPQRPDRRVEQRVLPTDGTAKVGEKWTSTSTLPLTGLDQEIEVTTKAKLVERRDRERRAGGDHRIHHHDADGPRPGPRSALLDRCSAAPTAVRPSTSSSR